MVVTANAPGGAGSIAPGVPNWVDLATPDLPGARAFYSNLLGWTPEVSAEPEAGGYTNFTLDGRTVAGVGPVMSAGQPPAWTTYLATDNADATAEKVEQAGGQVLMPPMDVMEYGRMGVFMDPTGAPFATWQPGTHPGAEVFNVPGALTWNELATRDTAGAKSFYGDVFDWNADDAQMGPIEYTTWKMGDRDIAGMMPMVGDEWPEELPAHWMAYFAVTDTDGVAARASDLGGTVAVSPSDIPVGRFAVLTDPQGAYFSVITLTNRVEPG